MTVSKEASAVSEGALVNWTRDPMQETPEFSSLKAQLTEEIRAEAMQTEGVH